VKGKTVTRIIPTGPAVERTRHQIAEYRRFRALVQAHELFPGAIEIVDRFNAKQHLSDLGKAVYGPADPRILHGGVRYVEQGQEPDPQVKKRRAQKTHPRASQTRLPRHPPRARHGPAGA
jgi:hypothetical protein